MRYMRRSLTDATRLSRASKVAAVMALAFLCVATAAVAYAPVPHGKLTAAEYQQMQTLKRTSKTRVCRELKPVSGLVASERSACLQMNATLSSLNGLDTKIDACSKKKVANVVLSCMVADLRDLSSGFGRVLAIVRGVRRAATARGFRPACVAALSMSKHGLDSVQVDENNLNRAILALQEGNLLAFEKYAKKVADFSGSSLSSGPLSVCPHE
ncbi:MAG TPA: hypothetical protein VME01_01250 [Solirubrobacteraceae bacterium]|nr:hypothetical protein [Solirubrobacteraceae bacterium]